MGDDEKEGEDGMLKRIVAMLIIGMLFLGGAGLMIYPAFSSWYMARHQGAVVADYDEKAAQMSGRQLEEEMEKAVAYNESLLGNVVLTDPFNAEAVEAQNEEYDELLNIAEDGVMGSVEIPAIEVFLPIYHGTDSEALEKGAGHLQNSSLPVGGTGTHSVISGHTALPTAELFNRVSEMEEGDVFYVHVLRETLAYEVDQIKVVLPADISDLLIDKDEDYVTLVTCTPYGINSHRLLVRGTRIPYEDAIKRSQDVRKKKNPLRGAYVAAALAAVALLLGGTMARRKKRKAALKKEKTDVAAKTLGKARKPSEKMPSAENRREDNGGRQGTQRAAKEKKAAKAEGANEAGKMRRNRE